MSGSECPASLGTLCPSFSWEEALHAFVLAPRHPKFSKSSPAAWELLWTTLEVLCLFQAICSQLGHCFYLRSSTFCLHSHPFLTFSSRWWCRTPHPGNDVPTRGLSHPLSPVFSWCASLCPCLHTRCGPAIPDDFDYKTPELYHLV